MTDIEKINERLAKLEEAQQEVGKSLLLFKEFVDGLKYDMAEITYVKKHLVNLVGVLIDRVFVNDKSRETEVARTVTMRLFDIVNGDSSPPK